MTANFEERRTPCRLHHCSRDDVGATLSVPGSNPVGGRWHKTGAYERRGLRERMSLQVMHQPTHTRLPMMPLLFEDHGACTTWSTCSDFTWVHPQSAPRIIYQELYQRLLRNIHPSGLLSERNGLRMRTDEARPILSVASPNSVVPDSTAPRTASQGFTAPAGAHRTDGSKLSEGSLRGRGFTSRVCTRCAPTLQSPRRSGTAAQWQLYKLQLPERAGWYDSNTLVTLRPLQCSRICMIPVSW